MHGHSHDGGGSCNHGHAHTPSLRTPANVGFGDEGGGGGGAVGAFSPQMNPMMMMMAQQIMQTSPQQMMSPQMIEFAKKMQQQRQLMMKEFQEKGGHSNPQAMQELMQKAAQFQEQAIAQFKAVAAANQSASSTNDASSSEITKAALEATHDNKNDDDSTSTSLLSANLNTSKLEDLINKRSTEMASLKASREEEERKILEAIANKDYSNLNVVKATQYGVIDRLKELVESKQVDVNKPDTENVYLLHWASINNRLEIAKYLLSLGVNIDQTGGELESTPLNWAARSGHIAMVILLMQHGANPCLFDIEGFSTIHLATMFAHSNVVAYLLVKGIDPDMVDKSGVTSLMYAAQRVQSRDPAQLLITYNARLNAQDSKGNTPLHYCIAYNNPTVLKLLLMKGATPNITNNKGQTPLDLAYDRKKFNAAAMLKAFTDLDKDQLPSIVKPLSSNKDVRKFFTRFYPFFLLFYFGFLFDSNAHWIAKLFFFALAYAISYTFQKLFFDRNVNKIIPMAFTLAIISWLYITWFIYFRPHVFDFSFYSLLFVLATTFSWYNLYWAYKTDPGVLKTTQEQMNKTILKFVEQNEFTIDNFCSACIIRKPIRSKHCAECDRCVAKFDHHCPWVDNCIGQNNLKYFIGFLFWTPICLMFFMHGSFSFYNETCYVEDLVVYKKMSGFRLLYQFMMCSPWVGFFTGVALLNLIWIGCLFICHFYQAVFVSLTTNERLNFHKYKHFEDKNGKFKNPFNFGVLQNTIDLLELRILCLKPTLINWKKEHDINDLLKSRLDKKKEYMDV